MVPTRREIENFKKIAKKFQNLKNTIMASFLAKIGWKRVRKTENKNYHCVSFLPDRYSNFQQNRKKIQRN